MKKVLIISSTPRKNGNSDMLCDQFFKGAKESGNKVEKISLKDLNIGYCTGCGVCYNTRKCVQNDDAQVIIKKMIDSDVIVMATPVYFFTMCGQLKTLIDRTCSEYVKINDKEFYFIATLAEEDPELAERALEGMRGFTACLNGPVEKGVLVAPGLFETGKVNGTKFMDWAHQMGKGV